MTYRYQFADHVIAYLLWQELRRVPPMGLTESGLRFNQCWYRS